MAGEDLVPVKGIGTLDILFHSDSNVVPVTQLNSLVVPEIRFDYFSLEG